MTKKELNLKFAELAVELLKAEMLAVNNGVGDSGLYRGQYPGFPSYDIYNDLTVQQTEDGFSINLPGYFIFIEKGRRKEVKAPPLSIILAWMNTISLYGTTGKSRNSIAYAIGRSIVHNGIIGRPFIDAALTAIVESSTIDEDILEYFDDAVSTMIKNL
ncbi:MAG: hypothetical protein MUO21_00340 [Nitrososphaeraceae archaeon]|nr:hypothetical protein [Nitrososphaeraceae archaeon]